MFKRTLLKSVATTAAVGSMFAVAQIAAPTATTAAPEIKTVACNGYQSTVVTTTRLSLERAGGQYGNRNAAHVKVTSQTGARPSGSVRITVAGVTSYTVRLTNGEAAHSLPRTLSASRTYEVRARYLPVTCSIFKASSSAPRFYTVQKARTRVAPVGARNIRRAGHPVVKVSVSSSTGMTPRGKAVVRLFKNHKVRAMKTVTLSGGDATARFGRVFQRGMWEVTVVYRGNSNFLRSQNSTTFRVRR